MSPETILLAGFGLAVAAVLFWKLAWPKLAVPSGIHIGPIINGKTRSVGMPKSLDNGGFTFPLKGGHVNAIVKPTGKVGDTVTLCYRIEADPGVRFLPSDGDTTGIGTISLLLQAKGEDYRGLGFKRLYSPTFSRLAAGEHTMTFDLNDPAWFGPAGGSSIPPAGGMAELIDNLESVQVVFGKEYANRAHGVYATGPAKFTLLELSA